MRLAVPLFCQLVRDFRCFGSKLAVDLVSIPAEALEEQTLAGYSALVEGTIVTCSYQTSSMTFFEETMKQERRGVPSLNTVCGSVGLLAECDGRKTYTQVMSV